MPSSCAVALHDITGCMRRARVSVVLASALLAACRASRDATPSRSVDSAAPIAAAVAARPPMTLDTAGAVVLQVWPMAVAAGTQLDETRRIVEHLQADLALVPGFLSATLLGSGDGSSLVLLAAWQDDGAADRGTAALAGWLRIPADTAGMRARLGSGRPEVAVRRIVGTPPVLSDAAMLQFTRYVMKPGHSFGALATLADSNLAIRVLQDTAAQGGVLLASLDSGALYMVMQARDATALDPLLLDPARLPFWAPFATRDERLMAVVATVHHR